MPTALTPHLVENSIAALSDWTGDTSAIQRTIRLDSQQQVVDLIGAVQVSAQSLGHEPRVERDGTAVTFTLATEDLGGVTEVDIALAAHIDNLAGRLVNAPPTPGPTSASASADETARLQAGAGRNHMPDVVVDHEGQTATAATAKTPRRRRRATEMGVPSNTGGGVPAPGVAVPEERPGHPEPGPEPEQRPRRRR